MSAPLVPAEIDLRGSTSMFLNVKSWREGPLAWRASGEAFKAALLLCCAAWHQRPAASLPNDDAALCHLSGLGRDLNTWLEIREEALQEFQLCDDGRLYHREAAQEAIKAWRARSRYAGRPGRRKDVDSALWSELRVQVFQRDGFICQYCGTEDARLECDHVVPLSRGGATTLDNLKTACARCNRSKGDKMLSEWRRVV